MHAYGLFVALFVRYPVPGCIGWVVWPAVEGVVILGLIRVTPPLRACPSRDREGAGPSVVGTLARRPGWRTPMRVAVGATDRSLTVAARKRGDAATDHTHAVEGGSV